MTAYVFMIVSWLAGYYFMLYRHRSKPDFEASLEKRKKYFILFAGAVLFLIMGLRHRYVGVDTMRYLERYRASNKLDWSYFSRTTGWIREEMGFTLVGKLLGMLGVGNQTYLILYALFISFCISRLVYRWCKNLFFGFYFHTTMGLFTMSMSGMRQSIACCICWLATDYIYKKKPIPFILLVLLASTFHQSAIFYLAFYFIGKIKVGKFGGWILWFGCLSLLVLRPLFITLLSYFMPEKYGVYGMISDKYPINPILVGISLLIPMFCLFFWDRNKFRSEEETQRYFLCFIGSFLYSIITILSLSSNMIGRMSQYFYIFNVVLLGNIIADIRDYKTRYIAIIFAILLPGYMFFKSQSLGIAPYYFFWQVYKG
ncbi:MAG: EpsG family protein [Clostridia bacterium]|nr:EpsG family protein [Clostridia bacterium]